jgi:hypothetical protein
MLWGWATLHPLDSPLTREVVLCCVFVEWLVGGVVLLSMSPLCGFWGVPLGGGVYPFPAEPWSTLRLPLGMILWQWGCLLCHVRVY